MKLQNNNAGREAARLFSAGMPGYKDAARKRYAILCLAALVTLAPTPAFTAQQETGKPYDACIAQWHEAALQGELPLFPWEAWFRGPKSPAE